jgi:hypothetical protein
MDKRSKSGNSTILSSKVMLPSLLFLSAILIQTIFLFVLLPARYHVNDNYDYWISYKPIAENILAGNGLVNADHKIAMTYPPGYPSMIAATFAVADRIHVTREHALDAANILITSLSCLVLFLTAKEAFGERIALLTWFLWMSYLPNLWTIVRPNSETPFMLLLFLSIWVFLRTMRKGWTEGAIIVGVGLGLAALIRPIGVFLPLVFGACALLYGTIGNKKRIVIASLIVGAFLICVTPWESYVMSKTGKLVLLCTNGPSSMADGFTFALHRNPEDHSIWAPADVVNLMERAAAQRSGMQTTGAVLRFASREAIAHPSAFAELLLMKLYRPWYAMATKRHESAILLLQAFYLPLGLIGLFWAKKRCKEQALPIGIFISVVAYFWGMAFLVLPIMRYMVPALGYVIVFAAIGLDALVTLAWSDRRSDAQTRLATSPVGVHESKAPAPQSAYSVSEDF